MLRFEEKFWKNVNKRIELLEEQYRKTAAFIRDDDASELVALRARLAELNRLAIVLK